MHALAKFPQASTRQSRDEVDNDNVCFSRSACIKRNMCNVQTCSSVLDLAKELHKC
jgi:hypothetical protein